MAGSVSISLRNRLLQAFFTPDVYSRADQLYVAVTSAVGTANAPGNTLVEPTAGAYSRAQVPLNSDWWEVGDGGDIRNNAVIPYPDPELGDDWGYLGGWALVDAPTGGMTLAVGSLITPQFFTSDQPPLRISPGGITVILYD